MSEAGAIAKTLIRVFIAAVISTALTTGFQFLGGSMTTADWYMLGNAGITAVLTAGLVYVDPKDSRYGVGS